MAPAVRLLTRTDVEQLLDVPSCIAAVEDAFRRRGEGQRSPSGVLGVHVEDGGFHAKAAALTLARPYFVAKVNANFPGNPTRNSLPTIQGVLVLFDAACGSPLAVMDSASITTLRTAAASAVAAKHAARRDSSVMTIVGCGVQARAHVAALCATLPIKRLHVFDLRTEAAERFATEMSALHDVVCSASNDLGASTRESDVVVTCTTATSPFLGTRHIVPGAFVAAVGADNEHKSEIEPSLMQRARVVVDDLEQCATIGDLHHAIAAGVIARTDAQASLGDVVAGRCAGRSDNDEIIVFDSTGVAIEDVAAAACAWERAVAADVGSSIEFAC